MPAVIGPARNVTATLSPSVLILRGVALENMRKSSAERLGQDCILLNYIFTNMVIYLLYHVTVVAGVRHAEEFSAISDAASGWTAFVD